MRSKTETNSDLPAQVLPCLTSGGGGGGGGGTKKNLIRGGSAPRSDPLPFYISFFAEKIPLSCTFHWQMVPLSCTFHWKVMKSPFKYLNDRFPYPFIYFDSGNPYPFIYTWSVREKGTPFGQSPPPPRVGHYRKYPRSLTLVTCTRFEFWLVHCSVCVYCGCPARSQWGVTDHAMITVWQRKLYSTTLPPSFSFSNERNLAQMSLQSFDSTTRSPPLITCWTANWCNESVWTRSCSRRTFHAPNRASQEVRQWFRTIQCYCRFE